MKGKKKPHYILYILDDLNFVLKFYLQMPARIRVSGLSLASVGWREDKHAEVVLKQDTGHMQGHDTGHSAWGLDSSPFKPLGLVFL